MIYDKLNRYKYLIIKKIIYKNFDGTKESQLLKCKNEENKSNKQFIRDTRTSYIIVRAV